DPEHDEARTRRLRRIELEEDEVHDDVQRVRPGHRERVRPVAPDADRVDEEVYPERRTGDRVRGSGEAGAEEDEAGLVRAQAERLQQVGHGEHAEEDREHAEDGPAILLRHAAVVARGAPAKPPSPRRLPRSLQTESGAGANGLTRTGRLSRPIGVAALAYRL